MLTQLAAMECIPAPHSVASGTSVTIVRAACGPKGCDPGQNPDPSPERAGRPLGDAERTEELAQSLGQPYVHLGMNMPAVALPDASPTAPEDVIIWFGVIDILQARASTFRRSPKVQIEGFAHWMCRVWSVNSDRSDVCSVAARGNE